MSYVPLLPHYPYLNGEPVNTINQPQSLGKDHEAESSSLGLQMQVEQDVFWGGDKF